MKRPIQHVTDSVGEAQLRTALSPLGWTLNKIDHDYGIDFDVEIFRDGKTTGVTFKLQLKSSIATAYSASRDFVSQPIHIEQAVYMANELRTPVILVHADITMRKSFWCAPQLDDSLLRRAASPGGAETTTIRIPTTNTLPESIERLLRTLADIEAVLASRVLIATKTIDFVKAIDGRVDKDQLSRELKNKSDAIKLEQAQTLFVAGSFEEATKKISLVLGSEDAAVESKFWALLIAERIEFIQTGKRQAPQGYLFDIPLAFADRLWSLTKKGPPYLKFYSMIARKAGELGVLVHRDYGMFMNWRVNKDTGDPFWKLQLSFQRAQTWRELALKYNHCLRLARYAVNSRYRWALPDALLRIVRAVALFIQRLDQEGFKAQAEKYSASALQLCRLTAWIALDNDDFDSVTGAALNAITATTDISSTETWARKTIEAITDLDKRNAAIDIVDRAVKRVKGEEVEGDIPATPRQIYENMATALGIDLSDPKDPIARIVRIGIADLDPSRVLKNCEHIFISLGPRGLPSI